MAERKKPNRSGTSFGGYMEPELAEAFDRYLEDAEPRPTKTSVIEMLLRQFLAEKGYYRPKRDKRPKKDPD